MASHGKIVGYDKSRYRAPVQIQCLSPLRSLCYLLFKTSLIASVGEALGFWRGDSINRGSGMTKLPFRNSHAVRRNWLLRCLPPSAGGAKIPGFETWV